MGVHADCVFVAGIHPSRTWMSGSFESVRWNACVHRLDLDLYFHQTELWGHWFRTHVNSKGKIPSSGGSGSWNPLSCITQASDPSTLPPELYEIPMKCWWWIYNIYYGRASIEESKPRVVNSKWPLQRDNLKGWFKRKRSHTQTSHPK